MPVGAENLCYLGRCLAERGRFGPVFGVGRVGRTGRRWDDLRLVGLKLVFPIVFRAVSVLGLARRESWWKDAEILMLRHQLVVAQRDEHGTRRIRVLGATQNPVQSWVVQQARNLLMDLDDAGMSVKFILHDQDATFTAAFDTRLPGRWRQGCPLRRSGASDELDHGTLDRLNQAAPLRPLPDGITNLDRFRVRRRDRAGGVIHEYRPVA